MIFSKKKIVEKVDYWSDTRIPANIFFYNLNNTNKSFLIKSGKPTEEELSKAWENIEDEYYSLREDKKSSLMMSTRTKIAMMTLKISFCQLSVNLLENMPMSDDHINEIFIKLSKVGVRLKESLSFKEKISIVKEQYIPSWETELQMEQDNLKNNTSEQVAEYEEALQIISDIKERHMPEDMSLKRFVIEEKSALKRHKAQLKRAS